MKLNRLLDTCHDAFGLAERPDIAVPGYADTKRVLSLTHEKLGLPQRRSFKKRLWLGWLAAALIIVTAVCGVSAVVQRRTTEVVFSEAFSGEPNVLGLYESRQVAFTSPDDNLRAEVLGMTADQEGLYAMLRVSYQDGRAFSEEGYSHGLYMPTGGSFDDFGGMLRCTQRNGQPLGASGMGGGFDCRYYLSDDRKEMKIYLKVNTDGLDAQGGTLTFISRRYAAQRITEVVEELPQVTAQDWRDRQSLLEQEGYHILRTGSGYALCRTEAKEFALPFEVTFSLDYRVDNNLWIHPVRSTVMNLLTSSAFDLTAVISGLGITLKTSCPPKAAGIGEPESGENGFRLICFQNIDSLRSWVTLEDGTRYYLVMTAGAGDMNHAANRFEENLRLQYKSIPDPAFADETIIVNTGKIRQIIVNGDIIYEKGADEYVGEAGIP